MRPTTAIALLTTLCACVQPQPVATAPGDGASGVAGRAETLAAHVGGWTQRQHDRFYGTQIEYLAEDGQSYLLMAGRAAVLQGQWLTRTGPRPGDAAQICFRYGADRSLTPDPSAGGNWTCQDGAAYLRGQAERVPGDPLGLAARAALPRALSIGPEVSISELSALWSTGARI